MVMVMVMDNNLQKACKVRWQKVNLVYCIVLVHTYMRYGYGRNVRLPLTAYFDETRGSPDKSNYM